VIADRPTVSPFDQAAVFRATAFFTTPLTQDNVESLCSDIANAVVHEFGKIDCGVMLLDRDKYHVLRIVRAGGYMVAARHAIVMDGPGLIAECLRTQQLLYVPDVRQHPSYVVGDTRTASELVIPLKAQGEILGVLDLQSPLFDAFSDQDQVILELFAERAAAMLYNILYALALEDRVYQQTQALVDAQEQMESVFSHTSDALALLDEDGNIMRVNHAFDMLFGSRGDGWSGHPMAGLVHDHEQERWTSAINSLAQQGHSRLEQVMRGDGGNNFTSDVALSTLGQGREKVLCSVRDITPRKQMELELRRSLEKSRDLTEMKTRFITTASHEFRTPLAIILASTELLYFYDNRMSGEQRTEHLMQIKQGVENMTSLLDNVLQVNASADEQFVDFRPTALDLRTVVQSQIELTQVGIAHQHELSLRFSGEDVPVMADADHLHGLLNHLLSNAVKFSPAGSPIKVQVRMSPHYTMLRVVDIGIGIPARDLPYVFEAFHKGSNIGESPGAGLGLTIVKQSVDLHHGKIKIRSIVGAGTTVIILLPGQLR
jgi:PAS domain S-box-containing protein